MASLAAWLSGSQYSNWNRTRRLHQTPYLARTETRVSRRAAAMAQQDAITINMADLTLNSNASASAATKKKQDTLFGPNIGIVARGPEWTESREKVIDELTPEVVKAWIAKSKQANQSTTTLQALVNLKRPSLRLTPLEIAAADDPEHIDSQHHHALEFEYDCDAPKCGMTVHVVVPPTHHLADKASGGSHSKILVFEAVTDGGFGKTLKLEEGATLELGRFEHLPRAQSPLLPDAKSDLKGDSIMISPALPTMESPVPVEEATEGTRRNRFHAFHFRKRTTQERALAGPALPVVDAEVKEEKEDEKEDNDALGVKAMICLTALDAASKPLLCVNEQTTYLHIVRFGVQPPAGEHDRRPWVVKVVKREATIGAHTFHLHEIYGLSSSTSNSNNAQPPTTYPPASPPGNTFDDEPSSECLLCLSAPREVVLLPCRHLVACRDCAVNMIEFGAGGQIVQQNDVPITPVPPSAIPAAAEGEVGETQNETTAATGDGEAEAGAETTAATATPEAVPLPMPIPAVVPTTTSRRKRKAKGWFCPVCRQPYTSCLRITTTPPSKDLTDDEQRESVDIADHPLASAPAPVTQNNQAAAAAGRGGLSSLRPGFLRTFARQPVPDLERGTAVSAASA